MGTLIKTYNPSFRYLSEPLNPYALEKHYGIFNNIENELIRTTKQINEYSDIILKMLPYGLKQIVSVNNIINFSDFYLILLLRKNVCDSVLSFVLADITDNWVVFDYDETAKFTLPTEHIQFKVNECVDNYKYIFANDINFYPSKIILTEDLKKSNIENYKLLGFGDDIGDNDDRKLYYHVEKSPDKSKVIVDYKDVVEFTNSLIDELSDDMVTFVDGKMVQWKMTYR